MPPQAERLPARLLAFADALRGEGVAVGTSELLDAFAALQQVSWSSQRAFREALACTLAKSPEDRRTFELVFDRFMFRAVEAIAIEPQMSERLGEGDAGAGLAELSDQQLEELRMRIAAALADGSEGAMRDLARLAIAALAREAAGSGVIGVDVQRIRRSLGLKTEPQPQLPPSDPRRDGVPREALRRFEALLRAELER
ncbi:MAG: CoxE, partial [Solirubrobacteraceae bacterium]